MATLTNFVVATNEFRGNGAPERTEYHNLVAWDRLAEICGQFLCRHRDLATRGGPDGHGACVGAVSCMAWYMVRHAAR